jgi:hypothetical protein
MDGSPLLFSGPVAFFPSPIARGARRHFSQAPPHCEALATMPQASIVANGEEHPVFVKV